MLTNYSQNQSKTDLYSQSSEQVNKQGNKRRFARVSSELSGSSLVTKQAMFHLRRH